MLIRHFALVVVVLLGTASCDWLTGSDVPAAYFEAEIVDELRVAHDESAAGAYEGTGEFHVTSGDWPEQFYSIHSSGTGDSSGEGIYFRQFGGDGYPDEGTFQFDLLEPETVNRDRRGLTGQYWVFRADSVREAYFIDGGELTITHANRDYLKGSFHLTGFRWCAYPEGDTVDSWCSGILPAAFPADLPRTEVSGSFVVTRREPVVTNPTDPRLVQ